MCFFIWCCSPVHRHDIALSHRIPPHAMPSRVRSHSESQSDDFQKMILHAYVYMHCERRVLCLYCIPSSVFIFLSFTCHTLIECNASVNGKKNAPKARSSKTFYPNYYSKESKRAIQNTMLWKTWISVYQKEKQQQKQKHKIGAKENRIQLLSSAPCVCVCVCCCCLFSL